MAKRHVPVVVGPTAVGKTAVTMVLAESWSVAVISADSRQVYRGLDIGTAKPSATLLARVPHRGIDVVDPGERYSAGRFASDAARWLDEIPLERQPIVVGGTGFYVRALADGLFLEPPLDTDGRNALRQWITGVPYPARWAVRLDRDYTGGGRQRAARAVEVALLTGRPLSWWQRRAKAEGTIRPWYVRLALPRAVLHQRIAARVRTMLEAGWIDEVRTVLEQGVPSDAPGLDAVGYREVVQVLRGELSEAKLERAIVTATRRYAKRQETWFRNQLPANEVVTLDATAGSAAVAGEIMDRWAGVREEMG